MNKAHRVPEKGIISHKHVAIVGMLLWQKKWMPVLEQLVDQFDGHASRAMAFAQQGDVARAMVEAELALSVDPLDAAMLNVLAMLYSRQQQWGGAETALQKAIHNNAGQHWLRLNYARVLQSRGETAKALDQVNFVLGVEPANVSAQEMRIAMTPSQRSAHGN